MPPREYQAWGPPGGPACLYTTADGIRSLMGQASWDPEHVHLFSIQARSVLDAMRAYHRAQGWEEYRPMLDENGAPYPGDVEEFE